MSYIHKIKKQTLIDSKWDYKGKQEKDCFGDYRFIWNKIRWDDAKKFRNYFEEKKKAEKEYFTADPYNLSEERIAGLVELRKKIIEKYFNITGDFMLTLTLK